MYNSKKNNTCEDFLSVNKLNGFHVSLSLKNRNKRLEGGEVFRTILFVIYVK
jgi:hypothetical protein